MFGSNCVVNKQVATKSGNTTNLFYHLKQNHSLEHAQSVNFRQGIDQIKNLKLLDPRYVLPGRNIYLTPRCLNFMQGVGKKLSCYFATATDLWSYRLNYRYQMDI